MSRAFPPLLMACSAFLATGAMGAASAAPLGGTGIKAAPQSAVVRASDDDDYYERRHHRRHRYGRRGPVVDTPYARVDAGDPVIVDAPYTYVGVHRGHVRVIAPYVNLWIPR